MMSAVQAQVLEEGESALVYYSPKTEITLEFTYMEEHFERGLYAEYAEAMLGITDAVLETKNICTLKDVRIGTATATDYSRPHKVDNEAGFPLLLNINDKGLLVGYNIVPEEKKGPKLDPKHHPRPDQKPEERVVPLSENVLTAASPEAQAHEIAKQIFHLRETRMYLINGEVEHAPADGMAMELVLNELAEQERALTELFTGRKCMHPKHKSVCIEPSNDGELLFFSEENGFTDGDNIDADTIEVRMVCQQQVAQPVEDKKKKKGTVLTQIVYNVPGNCAVNVLYKGRSMANRSIPVAQLGVDVSMPKSWFTGKELPKIIISEKTGNIVSVSK